MNTTPMNKIKPFLTGLLMAATALLVFGAPAALADTIPTVIGFYQDSLASPLTSAGTTMTLVRGTTYEGVPLNGYYAFVIDQGTASQEVIDGTAVGTSVTGLTRGLDSVTGTTTDATNIKTHARGASVYISTFPAL